MEIAPGIRRLGPGLVNAYLVEEQGGVTIVDAGAAGYWNALPTELAAMGRALDDVKAVVLTHAHSDHIGFAERIRRERGVPIRVHVDDVPLTKRPSTPKWQGSLGLGALRFIAFAIGAGMLRTPPPILEVGMFADGDTIDVPGRPRIVHAPGHSPGSAAIVLEHRDVAFVGDAFVTLDVLSGATGPRISPFNGDRAMAIASLSRLEPIAARIALPGHGAPWTQGLRAALAEVRRVTPT
ncbi:MAG TPA: MBL fold metallo-hydrolase [Candidatus Acidoferrales bacterium]|nr:MBL fold metallo-hydrolase [Candidatus Acidoferrales bacterium]